MRIKKNHWLLICSMALIFPLLGGCTLSDDVQAIFTDHAWKLSYISQDKLGHWYKFPNVSDSNYEAWDARTGTKSFILNFQGTPTDDVITGSFTGSGSVTANGTWTANGENNKFSANVKSGNADPNDKIGNEILSALKVADAYAGDTKYLYIYFTYNKERLYLAFVPAN